MPAGRLLKSKRREAKEIAKAIYEGIVAADRKKPVEESAKEHLGKAIDRVDPLELAIYAGLAAAGYEIFKDWKGALIGPIGLKLATSPSEIAAASGIITLAGLGIGVVIAGDVGKQIADALADAGLYSKAPVEGKCTEGFTLMYDFTVKTFKCVPNWQVWACLILGDMVVGSAQWKPTLFKNKEDCEAAGFYWHINHCQAEFPGGVG